MKLLNAAIVVGSVIAIATLAIATSRSALAYGSEAPIRLAVAGTSTPDRDSYAQKARAEVKEWQRKLHDFGEEAKAKGQEASATAAKELDKAWTKAEAAARDLQAASADGWDGAKATYESASHDLADAWDKVRPREK